MCSRITNIDWTNLIATVMSDVTITIPTGRVLGAFPISFQVDLVAACIHYGGKNASQVVRDLYDHRDAVFAEDLSEAMEELEEATKDVEDVQETVLRYLAIADRVFGEG